jgi:16S rRNA processing protein RimM
MTVRVPAGDASEWTAATRVWIGKDTEKGAPYAVESARAYRDRLVLKLTGIDDGNAAEALRGMEVAVAPGDAAPLEEGTYYRAQLVGLSAEDERGVALGTVVDVVPTQGHDLLAIAPDPERDEAADEILVPWVPEFVLDVDLEAARIRLRLPPGLLELNRE